MVKRIVRRLAPGEPAVLSPDLARQAGFCGGDAWMDFVHQVYAYPVYRLVVEEDGFPGGLLALAHIRHPLFGNYLTTAPFASYGGLCATSSLGRDALFAQARRLAQELNVDYTLIRHLDGSAQPPDGWLQFPGYATYLMELPTNADDLMGIFSSDHRNHIRKSLRKGFSIRFGRLELLEDCYRVISASMHELGSPYHSRRYLQTLVQTLGEGVELAVLYDAHNRLAGGGVFIYQGTLASNLHANILRRYRPDYAGEFLYWSAIRRCCELGMRTFDLGRSLTGSGNEIFKLKWRPARQALAYWHILRPGQPLPNLNQKNPKFHLAIEAWKRLPRPLVRLLGPMLIRGLA